MRSLSWKLLRGRLRGLLIDMVHSTTALTFTFAVYSANNNNNNNQKRLEIWYFNITE